MKKTTDIKIKKIEVKKKEEKVCTIWDQIEAQTFLKSQNSNKFTFVDLLHFLKQKIAYISFAFMSFSIALYIFFITSIIVFAVEERSYIFSAKQIEVNIAPILVQSEVAVKKENLANIPETKNLAVSGDVMYIKRIDNVNSGLSVR